MAAEPARSIYEVALETVLRDGWHTREVGGLEILLIATEGGLRAYSGVCPHLGGPLLEATPDRKTVVCPWHSYAFDAESGRCRTVPGARSWNETPGAHVGTRPFKRALVPLAFEVEGGVVRVFGRGR